MQNNNGCLWKKSMKKEPKLFTHQSHNLIAEHYLNVFWCLPYHPICDKKAERFVRLK